MLNSVGLVPLRVSWVSLTVPSWVQTFSLWVFCGSKIYSREYFVGPKFFPVGILWVQNFFSGVLSGHSFIFVGPKIFFVGVSGDVIVNKKNFRCGFYM